MKKFIDLTGMVFNKWTVVSFSHSTNKREYWHCECECGTRKSVSANSLLKGKSKSCGCIRSNDITGQKFGKLMVISRHSVINRCWHYNCICDCGVEKIINGARIRRGYAKSCGCLRKIQNSNHYGWTGHGEISSYVWSGIKKGARTRNIEFCISIDFGWELFLRQGRECVLTGIPLDFPKNSYEARHANFNASLDRINNKSGYLDSNVWWLDKDVNCIKWDHSIEELLYWCNLIVNKDISDYNIRIDMIKPRKGYLGCGMVGNWYNSRIKYGAKKRDIVFDIDNEYLWNLFLSENGRCKLTNIPLIMEPLIKNKRNQTASLDRIDSNKGYIEGNVRWIHKDLNIMKMDYTEQYFIEICTKIHSRRQIITDYLKTNYGIII